MTGKNIVGIVFSNSYDECLPELTGLRTMGSVPFAGRYRLIDFTLSNMVNAGIEDVGVITKANYHSLMDHIGTGKPWDLSRKTKGLIILPPYSTAEQGGNDDKIASLKGIMGFINRANEEYVLLSDCNTISNIDIEALTEYHTEKNSDITVVYKHGQIPSLSDVLVLDLDEDGRAKQIDVTPVTKKTGNYSLSVMFMKKSLLERFMNEAISKRYTDFETDLIQRNVKKLNIYGFEAKGYSATIDSLSTYFKASMELLDINNCNELFNSERPVYTKTRDDMPSTYGIGSNVKNSLVANGCIIDGEVENSIIFRGVRIEKGAVVRNSIVMQESFVASGSSLDYVIMDKIAVITPNRNLSGAENYPFYIGKGIVI